MRIIHYNSQQYKHVSFYFIKFWNWQIHIVSVDNSMSILTIIETKPEMLKKLETATMLIKV